MHQGLLAGAVGGSASWPAKVWAEKIRLKRYMPGGEDKFPPHVDVMNAEESKRFLTAISYLNTPGGGETVFPDLDVTVTPAPGRMVVFPPLWTFPHAGLPPRDQPKYILLTVICGMRRQAKRCRNDRNGQSA